MSKYQQQIKTGKLYAMLPAYKRALRFAQEGVAAMLALSPRSYLSVSFGKQSICLAHLIYQVAPDMPMFFLASGESWMIHNFAEVIDDLMRHTPINLTIVQTNRLGLDIADDILGMSERQPGIKWVFRGWEEGDLDWKAARDAGDKDLQEMCDRAEWDGWFWGLAKEESFGRRMTLSWKWKGQPHPSIFRYADGKYRCCPVMNWELQDIAAYVATHNLKLLSEYEEFGLEARTTARMTKMAAGEGGVAHLNRRSRAGMNRLAARFPEMRQYL